MQDWLERALGKDVGTQTEEAQDDRKGGKRRGSLPPEGAQSRLDNKHAHIVLSSLREEIKAKDRHIEGANQEVKKLQEDNASLRKELTEARHSFGLYRADPPNPHERIIPGAGP